MDFHDAAVTAPGSNNMNCVIELENRNFLNFSDFTQYTLASPDINALGLGDLGSHHLNGNNNNGPAEMSWMNQTEVQSPLQVSGGDFTASDMSLIKAIESIANQKTSTPCRGQGDGTDSPLLEVLEQMTSGVKQVGSGVEMNAGHHHHHHHLYHQQHHHSQYRCCDNSSGNNNNNNNSGAQSSATFVRTSKMPLDDNRVVYAALESMSNNAASCVNFETPRLMYGQTLVPTPPASSSSSYHHHQQQQQQQQQQTSTGPRFNSFQPRTLYTKDSGNSNGSNTLICNSRSQYPTNRGQKKIWRQSSGRSSFLSSSSSSSTPDTSSSSPSVEFSSTSFNAAPASCSSSSAVSMESAGSTEGIASSSSFSCSDSSLEIPKPPCNTPNSEDASLGSCGATVATTAMRHAANTRSSQAQLVAKLERLTRNPALDPRESHNAKERKRRSRIRDACNAMRRLIPSVNDRTDNATVFEHLAYFIDFLQKKSQNKFDFEFIQQGQQRKNL